MYLQYVWWPHIAAVTTHVYLHPAGSTTCVQNRSCLGASSSEQRYSDGWTVALSFSTYALQPSRLIARSGLDVPTFATRCLHACHHARAPSAERWDSGREMSGKFCLNSDLHITFRDILHAVKLRYGTDGFTSPPKEGVLRIFLA